MKTDCDLFACWERDKGNKVVLIDPFIGEGFEDFGSYDDYWQWFRAAIDEMIEYAVDEIEYAQKSSQ